MTLRKKLNLTSFTLFSSCFTHIRWEEEEEEEEEEGEDPTTEGWIEDRGLDSGHSDYRIINNILCKQLGCSLCSFKNKLWEALNNMCQAGIFTDLALRPIQSSSPDVCMFLFLSVYPDKSQVTGDFF